MPENVEKPSEGLRKEVAFTRLPNGELIGVFELMNRERMRGELQLNISLLKQGDIVAMQYSKDDGISKALMLKVGSTNLRGFGVSGNWGPHVLLKGELQGDDLPKEIVGKTVSFGGSGFGGSMRESGVLRTSRSPYFYFDGGEFHAPFINNFKVFRKDENGELRAVNQDTLSTESRKESEKHLRRLAQAEELMRKFGFNKYDIRDGSKSSFDDGVGHLDYRDDTYQAQYEAGMAMGNQLVIYNKKTGQWMEFKYFNYKDEDVLQVAFADLSNQDLDHVFITGRLVEESGIHVARVSITTFTTSSALGIEVANYQPSKQQTEEDFDFPEFPNKIPPDLQLLPDGKIKISDNYPFNMFEKEHPGLLEKIRNVVSFSVSQNGTISLVMNGNTVKLKNPDSEIFKILEHMKQSHQKRGEIAGLGQPFTDEVDQK